MFAPDGQDRQMVNLGADILDYFSKLWGRHTPSHSHNVQPCLWYTFLLHVHGHEYSSTRFCISEVNQLFEQNCIEKQIFNGTFTLNKNQIVKKMWRKKKKKEKNHCGGRLSFKTQFED
jgi:hypothetical protein